MDPTDIREAERELKKRFHMNISILFQMAPQKSFVREVIFTQERLFKGISMKVGREAFSVSVVALGLPGHEESCRRRGFRGLSSAGNNVGAASVDVGDIQRRGFQRATGGVSARRGGLRTDPPRGRAGMPRIGPSLKEPSGLAPRAEAPGSFSFPSAERGRGAGGRGGQTRPL